MVDQTQINPGVANAPIVEEVAAGKKIAWCSCGYSAKQPYCDGAHGRSPTNLRPLIVEITETKKYAFCACKRAANPPYCDGSHSRGL